MLVRTLPYKIDFIGLQDMAETLNTLAANIQGQPNTSRTKKPTAKNLFQCSTPTYLENWSPKTLDAKKLIHPEMKNRAILNVFRNLRTKLMTASNEKNFSLLVSSAVPASGASFVASNLAAAISMQRAKSAILIDANFYNPNITRQFELEGKPGLSEYLSSDMDADQAVFYPTGIPNLYVAPVGEAVEDGLELFTGNRMKNLVENMIERLGKAYVILDVPSLNDSADTPILLESCQRSLLVLPSKGVHQNALESALEAMKRAEFMGAIYNGTFY